jgi:hypothetical protein
MHDGIPIRAEERLEGRLLSETDFERGFPVKQTIDLDMNGTLETVRRFRIASSSGYYPDAELKIASQLSDFNDSGIPEYKEEYTEYGESSQFWDMDEDGVFEYKE